MRGFIVAEPNDFTTPQPEQKNSKHWKHCLQVSPPELGNVFSPMQHHNISSKKAKKHVYRTGSLPTSKIHYRSFFVQGIEEIKHVFVSGAVLNLRADEDFVAHSKSEKSIATKFRPVKALLCQQLVDECLCEADVA